MAENALRQLNACGQSVWNDFIRRTFITNGDLDRLAKEDGLTGVTSNPSIFEKAIGGSSDYDDDLRALVEQGTNSEEIFARLASRDVQMAADVLRPAYDRTQGHDGYVSIEVSPAAAHDTKRTLEDAHALWGLVDRPNVMIKVPATPEGVPAIEQLIFEGINVNITLIFAVEVYEQVMEAYLSGLERRAAELEPIGQIASVASFFVSRVDTLVDKLLEERAKDADIQRKRELKELEGRAAIANAKIAYQKFEEVFSSQRFKELEKKGAQVQRPLWASTSTKNSNYRDTLYVETLVGQETVNTMPPQTIVAVRDHGHIRCDSIKEGVPEAHEVVERLGAVGIHMREVTDQLTSEGVQLFADALNKLFATISQKADKIIANQVGRNQATLDGQQKDVDDTFRQMADTDFLARLWNKEPALWKPNPSEQNEISDRLGWLHVSDCMIEQRGCFSEAARIAKNGGFTHAVVLGMGGSSLAPYVLSQSFQRQDGYPELLVLDSTDPEAIRAIDDAVDIEHTLFLVSTKSGTTTETLSFFRTFWAKVVERKGEMAGENFFAITDPGTPLEALAKDHNFRSVFLNPSDIGGRYSALSYFGLIPAAVMGVDVETVLDRALRMEQACAPSVPAEENPGSWLGAVMAKLGQVGRDKVTFFVSPGIDTFGLWLEQLLAESTGKEGKGLVPVPDNPPGDPQTYADDRLFVYIRLDTADNRHLDEKVDALEKAGKPTVRLEMEDLYDLGAEFFRWEFATAVAGALLGINAFDQPNVQESKDNTKRVLSQLQETGSFPEPELVASQGELWLYANAPAQEWIEDAKGDMRAALSAFFGKVKAPHYLATMAYIAPLKVHDEVLGPLRIQFRDNLRVATTMGYGPRFLHSTGQLHKGGPPEGVFLQITADALDDVSIPDEPFSYQTLIRAQSLGDLRSLEQHGRPALRLHVGPETRSSLERMSEVIQEVIGSPVATL